MKYKYLILILHIIILVLVGCSTQTTDYTSIGYNCVLELKEKTTVLSDKMILDKDNKIDNFECDYPCNNYAFKSSFKTNDKYISNYDELIEWFSEICSEEYTQKIFNEFALINYNNEIYYTPVDMLLDMYDYDSSSIVSYTIDDTTITYVCEATGYDGGGEPKEILTYTFSLVNDGGNWKFTDCSFDGYCNYRLFYTLE